MKTHLLTCLAGLAFGVAGYSQNSLSTYSQTTTPGQSVTAMARIQGPAQGLYVLYAAPHTGSAFNPAQATRVASGFLDAGGRGVASWQITGLQALPSQYSMDFSAALYRTKSAGPQFQTSVRVDRGSVQWTDTSTLPLNGSMGCEVLDFDFTIGPNEPVAGMWMTDQWSLIGLNISADNKHPNHPDKAIVFDSANPTGGDFDLQTPGSGAGNTTALGNLLIIAENDTDLNNDGLVDDPDDEAWGGSMIFNFDQPAVLCSATLIDIDDQSPTSLVFSFFDGSPQVTIPVANAGNNSVQKVSFMQTGVSKLEVILGGSGGLAEIEFLPCPRVLLFDEEPTGRPMPANRAGMWVTDELATMYGVTIAANNNHKSPTAHPDKAILFDTANPTGGDFDLQTPGYGLGNTKALGMALIVAENDVDLNNDGYVDDPDDEADGGTITISFDQDIDFYGATVIDIDKNEFAFFRLRDEFGNFIADINLANLGDNSVQELALIVPYGGVRTVELHLSNSGALSRVRWCPSATTTL